MRIANALGCSYAIQEDLDKPKKNETWKFVPPKNIEPGHKLIM